MLLRLARSGRSGSAAVEIPVLAEMAGTTRSRVNVFMNRFRRKGYIDYDGDLEVHQSLRKALPGRLVAPPSLGKHAPEFHGVRTIKTEQRAW